MGESNPWKKISSKIVYRNPWIVVREDSVTRPDGKPGIYGVVETRLAVGIVAFTPGNEIYLVGQYRYPTNCYSWEIIEGGSEEGEEPIETAKRELQEEAGIVASSWEQLGGEVHLTNCHSSERAVFFVARDLTECPRSPDCTEVLEIKKVPFDDALRMVNEGEIVDAMSIIALQRVPRP